MNAAGIGFQMFSFFFRLHIIKKSVIFKNRFLEPMFEPERA